jgi:hypothetical protein
VQTGKANTLMQMLSEDKQIRSYLSKEAIIALLDATLYTGDSEERTHRVVAEIREVLSR